jgi:hypothetical protein
MRFRSGLGECGSFRGVRTRRIRTDGDRAFQWQFARLGLRGALELLVLNKFDVAVLRK